jgi:class 3 adenylate cyclase
MQCGRILAPQQLINAAEVVACKELMPHEAGMTGPLLPRPRASFDSLSAFPAVRRRSPSSRMESLEGALAWLERPGTEPVALTIELTIGRAIDNQLILPDERVSRHHALIHRRSEGEYSLVDLGTFVNDRRVMQPRRLFDGDRISIGGFVLMFRQPSAVPAEEPIDQTSALAKTGVHVLAAECWLLICDIQGSTKLAAEHGVQEWARLCGGWFYGCKRIIEKSGGCVADYLGDGFIAYWKNSREREADLAITLRQLRSGQEQCPPPFRMVVHFGAVSICGQPGRGEETLFGSEVHYAFRMEKVAGSMGEKRTMSDAARQRLGEMLPTELVGRHPLPGFEGEHALWRF